MRRTRRILSNFRDNLLMAIPIVLVLGATGGWFLARRSLSPIAHITEKARQITASNLGDRLESRGSGDELDHLIRIYIPVLPLCQPNFTFGVPSYPRPRI